MISARYATPTAIVLALALVPTGIHTYRGDEANDGWTARAIPAVLEGMSSTQTGRKPAWVKNNLASDDWIERLYQNNGEAVFLFVGRSYDSKRLYHHPELALLRGTETKPAGVMHTMARPDIPLHVLETQKNGQRGTALYALLYDGRFIDAPVLFQLRTSVELLVSRRKPMTLFLASDLSGRVSDVDHAAATRVLLAAIEAFQSQTRQTDTRPAH
jgi:hypothetical protein